MIYMDNTKPAPKVSLGNRTTYDPNTRSIERSQAVPDLEDYSAEVYAIPLSHSRWTESLLLQVASK